MPNNPDELGALWRKTSKTGATFLSGQITIDRTVYQIVCFENTKKTSDRQPDFRILQSRPLEGQAAAPRVQEPKNALEGPFPDVDINPEDIPF